MMKKKNDIKGDGDHTKLSFNCKLDWKSLYSLDEAFFKNNNNLAMTCHFL